jgi:hypothetical protein
MVRRSPGGGGMIGVRVQAAESRLWEWRAWTLLTPIAFLEARHSWTALFQG